MEMNHKILVIDDQEGIRRLLEEACAYMGYQAITASNCRDALKRMAEHEFKAALVDLQMPGIGGMETLKEIRTLAPDVKRIVMTGFAPEYFLDDFREGLLYEVLHKPFDLDDLKSLLDRACQ